MIGHVSCIFTVLVRMEHSRTHTLVEKQRERSFQCCGLTLLLFTPAAISTSFIAKLGLPV